MIPQQDLKRRDFLRISVVAGAGLILTAYLPGCTQDELSEVTREPTEAPVPPTNSPTITPAKPEAVFVPNAHLSLTSDGRVVVTVHRSEMGQGVRTALPMIVAEDLEVDWGVIEVVQAPAEDIYGDQVTGGSTSISLNYGILRRLAASARTMLIGAAAQVWGVDQQSCEARQGEVIHAVTDRRLAYCELVEIAAQQPVPELDDIQLKSPNEFRVIGTRVGRIDNSDIVTGRAIYGTDVVLPGMLHAVIARPPMLSGSVASFDASAALAVSGVKHVVQISRGIAVVAENTWAAITGRDALQIEWGAGRSATISSDNIRTSLTENRLSHPADPAILQRMYEIPFLAHATMEPMNCTADVRSDRCEVWVPTQDAMSAKGAAANASGLPRSAVTVHITLIGGGFGRRLAVDYVSEAVELSKRIGAPVKVLWTRQDDIQHDLYHPMSATVVQSALDDCEPSIGSQQAGMPVPTGYWRAVGNVARAFAREIFIDEYAEAVGKDPVDLRLEMLNESAGAVVKLAAEKAGWGTPLPDGWGRGFAHFASWGATDVAQVVEVAVNSQGEVAVQRVVCAVDCGIAVNPDMVEQQMESGIVFGLSAALYGEITIEQGRIQQSNFHDYPILRYHEMPRVEVYIVPSTKAPTGVGEMSNPVTMPALLNAIYAATGKRIRHIPVRPMDLQVA